MIILDLDGCISNDAWRIPSINWQKQDPNDRYHDYHSLAPWDELGNRDLIDGHDDQITILTARPVSFRAATVEWLKRNDVPFRHLIMRNIDDHRPSVKLKETQLAWLRSHYGVPFTFIKAAYDDRPEVVEMYRSKGINAHVRALHDVCAYTPPSKK